MDSIGLAPPPAVVSAETGCFGPAIDEASVYGTLDTTWSWRHDPKTGGGG